MIFTLKSYSDLGRCSYATLKESFDSEKDEIYLKDVKVEINKLEDLFPFLWQATAIGFYDNKEHKSVCKFYSDKPWWHNDYDKSIEECDKEIQKLNKKIVKGGVKDKTIERWKQTIDFTEKHKSSLINLIERLDNELKEQKLKLIKENTNEH